MAYISFQPNQNYAPVAYSGTGASNSITGVGFQPDFTWIKERNGGNSHMLTDVIRGVGFHLESNGNASQITQAQGVTAFGTDGFTLGTYTGMNTSGQNFISWNWKGSNGTTSNGEGSVTTTVSANPTMGFSVVKWDGGGATDTIGHGLGAIPKLIIIKRYNDGSNAWQVYYVAGGNNMKMYLSGTDGSTSSGWMNSTNPTSTVFTVTNDADINDSGGQYVAYCFANVKGAIQSGKYKGNGNADGPFIHTGFRPGWIMCKRYSDTGNWVVWDTKRDGYNGDNSTLDPNTADQDDTGEQIDILSNGFKMRNTGTWANASGSNYIYLAVATIPFVSSNSKAGTSR